MISQKYRIKVENIARKKIPDDVKLFVFGSSIDEHRERFYDIDLGVIGKIDGKIIHELREDFEESDLPYKIDVVNFNEVDEQFSNAVFSDKVLWL